MNFKDKTEAVGHYKSLGHTDVEAEEKATEYFVTEDKITKSLQGGITAINTGLEEIKTAKEGFEDSENKIVKLRKSLKKALEPEDGKDVDAEAFLIEQGKTLADNAMEMVNLKKSLTASNEAILVGQKNIAMALEGLHQRIKNDAEINDVLGTKIEELHKSLKRTVPALSNTGDEKGKENNANASEDDGKELTEDKKIEKINKSLSVLKIRDTLVAVACNPTEYKALVGDHYPKDGFTEEIGTAKAYGYVYKSLTPKLKHIIDTKLKPEIDEIIKKEEPAKQD